MPELPEVETIRRGLTTSIIDKTIQKITIHLPKTFVGDTKLLQNKKILEVQRRGKLLIIHTGSSDSPEYSLLTHLKMTGQIILNSHLQNPAIFPNTHTRVTIELSDDEILYFQDARTFGYMKLIPTSEAHLDSFLSQLGPEPLEAGFTENYLTEVIKKHPLATIKALLLSQNLIAGIGNIYADESLFLAGILPMRKALTLTESEIHELHHAIQTVLTKGINLRGSSRTNYVDISGERGSFLQEANVYQRTGQPCKICGNPIQKTVVAGRGTHYCSSCQK